MATICTVCSCVHNAVTDGKFLTLNPIALGMWNPKYTTSAPELEFCSTVCLSAFLIKPENKTSIALLDPAKLPGPSDETLAFLKETSELTEDRRKAIYDDKEMLLKVMVAEHTVMARHLHMGYPECQRCAPYGEHSSGIPSAIRPGPFLYIEGGEWLGDTQLRGSYCSIDCYIAYANEHPYAAHGWWTSPERERCAHCHEVFRNDCDMSFIDLKLADGRVSYCSSACLLAALETLPRDKIGWVPFKDAVGPESPCCMHCGAGEEGSEPVDQDVQDLFTEAERLNSERQAILDKTKVPDPSFTIVVSPTLSKPSPVLWYVETEETKALEARANELRQRAFSILDERQEQNPLFQKPFIVMNSGYGLPVDGGGIFCSVECVKSLFTGRDYCHYDAKGKFNPRPTT